jgi:hypothetical protein
MKTLLSLVITLGLSLSAFAGREHAVGIWNDGRAGDNMGFYFSADGSGDCIAFIPSQISWTYDAPSKKITIKFRDGRIWRMTFDEKYEKLIPDERKMEGQTWIFHRLDEAALEKWLEMKKKNEPNKAVEPTTIHVTVCAYAQPAPCMVAAHF